LRAGCRRHHWMHRSGKWHMNMTDRDDWPNEGDDDEWEWRYGGFSHARMGDWKRVGGKVSRGNLPPSFLPS
jgi:hypothetical protein